MTYFIVVNSSSLFIWTLKIGAKGEPEHVEKAVRRKVTECDFGKVTKVLVM